MGDPYAETNAIARRELIDRLYRELAAKNAEIERLRAAFRQVADVIDSHNPQIHSTASLKYVAECCRAEANRPILTMPADAKEAM